MLHTINQSPFGSDSLNTVLRFVQPGDPILFLQDGVYAVQSTNRFAKRISEIQQSNPVYALQPDLQARGIVNPGKGVKLIDHAGFVDLVAEHPVSNWL